MLRQGDTVRYIPSGRTVEVQEDQNRGDLVWVMDKDRKIKPHPILGVNPGHLEMITRVEDRVVPPLSPSIDKTNETT